MKNPGDKELKWKIDYPNSNNTLSNVLTNSHHTGSGSIQSFNSITPTSSNVVNTQSVVLTKNYNQQPDNRFCFEIENKKGTVKPQAWECINVVFNPYEAGIYCYKLPLLIYNEERGVYQQ